MATDNKNLTNTERRALYDLAYQIAKGLWDARNAIKIRENGGRRFKNGKAQAAHLRGRFRWIRNRANRIFGGPRP